MIEKSERVKRLLNDPDLKEAFEIVREYLLQQFEQTTTDDVELMREIRVRLQLLDTVRTNLEQAITDGTVEAFNAKQRKSFWNIHKT